jgi:hypothetical protein
VGSETPVGVFGIQFSVTWPSPYVVDVMTGACATAFGVIVVVSSGETP